MRRVVLLPLIFTALSCSAYKDDFPTEEIDERSYALGYKHVTNSGYDAEIIDSISFSYGAKDAIEGDSSFISDTDMDDLVNSYHDEIKRKKEAKDAILSKKNIEAGINYMLINQEREGVKVLESGVQYEIISLGNRITASEEDSVLINYTSRLIDGTELESSNLNDPVTVPLSSKMISGFKEALMMMGEGSKWRVVIPPNEAYGEARVGPIEPSSTLVFDIEVIEVIDEP